MRLVIIGAGGHGRVLAECAQAAQLPLVGFVDDNLSLSGTSPLGLPILGTISALESALENKRIGADGILLGIGNSAFRLRLLHTFRTAQLSFPMVFPTLFHPRAWVSPSAICGAGTVVMANASVQTGCRLGAGVILNTNASVDHDSVIGDGVHLCPGVHLAGNVTVGDGTFIGIGASVIPGIRIGKGCLVAAGAVVVRDVPDGQRVAGVPARPLTKQESKQEAKQEAL